MELDVNWKRAVKILWACTWRTYLTYFLFIISLVFISNYETLNILLYFFGYFFFSIYCLKKVFNKGFDEFDIVLMKKVFKRNELSTTNVNTELEITWKRSLIIFWAYHWRTWLASTLILSVIPIIIAVIYYSLNLSFGLKTLPVFQNTFIFISTVFVFTISIYIYVYYFKKILKKDFGKFNIVLIKK